MPNGKPADNPMTDMLIYGKHPFPIDIEEMLRKRDTLGKRFERWPLGENWPFSPHEFEWEKGINLDDARLMLSHFIELLEAGRGDELMINPRTRKPLIEK